MRRFIFPLLILLLSAGVRAQSTEMPDMVLGFSMKEIKNLATDQQNLLRSKVLEAVTAHQAGIYDYNLQFYIQPEFAIVSRKTADGGLRKIEVVNAKLLLSIMSSINHEVVSATSVAVQGSGTSGDDALTSAVDAIDPNAPAIQEFLVKSREKIAAYYKNKCNTIVNDVNTLIVQKQYEVAIVRLGTMPENQVPCSDKLKPLKLKVLQLYRQQKTAQDKHENKDTKKEAVAKRDGGSAKKKPVKGKSSPQQENAPTNPAGQQQANAVLSAMSTGASSGAATGNGDPARSIAAAILNLRQIR